MRKSCSISLVFIFLSAPSLLLPQYFLFFVFSSSSIYSFFFSFFTLFSLGPVFLTKMDGLLLFSFFFFLKKKEKKTSFFNLFSFEKSLFISCYLSFFFLFSEIKNIFLLYRESILKLLNFATHPHIPTLRQCFGTSLYTLLILISFNKKIKNN